MTGTNVYDRQPSSRSQRSTGIVWAWGVSSEQGRPGESAVNKVDSESTDGLVEETDSGQAMPVNDLIASVASTAKEMCRVSNGVT